MTPARLPHVLMPQASESLVRLGGRFDGGYLVDERDVQASAGLLSLGIADDWAFETDFMARRDVPLDAYDATTSRSRMLGDALRLAFGGQSWGDAVSKGRAAIGYGRFFGTSRRHLRRFIGGDHPPHFIALREAFETLQQRTGDGPLFIKCDIEGWEHRSLGDLLALAPHTSGLAIEFHDCDMQMARITDFVERYPLRLVHVHANNGAPIVGGIPLALELTFSSSPVRDGPARLPHPLDAPNVADQPEITIEFGGRA